jgi:dGTPase
LPTTTRSLWPTRSAPPELIQFRASRATGTDEQSRPGDVRTPAERDRDRVLYSTSFRRLAAVTQVFEAREVQIFHNRLTHSLKVAQVGRRLAEKLLTEQPEEAILRLGGIDPDVVETACLAHDIGHPPFGHVAERALQTELAADEHLDSFEGNAQSFRIVTKLEVRDLAEYGLNLTRATLHALLKYPRLYETGATKWGAYRSESAIFQWATERLPAQADLQGDRSIEAAIMDYADDVTYAVHDLEDFYRAGLIPLDRLFRDDRERSDFLQFAASYLLKSDDYDSSLLEHSFNNLADTLPEDVYRGTASDHALLNACASSLITKYLASATLGKRGLEYGKDSRYEIALLKQITWYYVIQSPALSTIRHGQSRLISRLFHLLDEWVREFASDEQHRLPAALAHMLQAVSDDREADKAYGDNESSLRRRAITDYVASLTEEQAIRLDRGSASSTLESWMRV